MDADTVTIRHAGALIAASAYLRERADGHKHEDRAARFLLWSLAFAAQTAAQSLIDSVKSDREAPHA